MRFVPILFIILFAALFITIFPNIFGGFEVQHNMTASNYTEEYNALTTLTQTDLVIIGVVGTVMVLGMLFIFAKIFG